jgi:hypothetical protein
MPIETLCHKTDDSLLRSSFYRHEVAFNFGMILVNAIADVCGSLNLVAMLKYIIQAGLFIILFVTLYSIYKSKTGRYKRHKQVITALIGAFLLMYILYTCNSDN